MVDTFDISPDKKTWTFTLRDGLEFHDGQPVTSDGRHRIAPAMGHNATPWGRG